MAYEPKGKVKTLIDAMDADPAREWTAADAAEVMRTTNGGVHAFVARAIEAKVLFRSLSNGRTVFSRKPFTEASCVSRLPEVPTTANGWKPPQMGCTRPAAGTTAPTAAPTPASSPAPTVTLAPTERELSLAHSVVVAKVVAEEEPQQDDAADVTWAQWEDGDLDLHGLVELEGGGHRMPAEAVRRFRKFIAWMPA